MENRGADQEPKPVPFGICAMQGSAQHLCVEWGMEMQYSVDAILLTYKPGKQVMELIEALEKQRYPIRKIIIMNTEERYFYNLFTGRDFWKNTKISRFIISQNGSLITEERERRQCSTQRQISLCA